MLGLQHHETVLLARGPLVDTPTTPAPGVGVQQVVVGAGARVQVPQQEEQQPHQRQGGEE